MSDDGSACDACRAVPAPLVVTSPVGLVAWNREHPDDVREALYFCSLRCCYRAGYFMGMRADVAGTA
jgi:hypothetical protein